MASPVQLRPIADVAGDLGLTPSDIEPYGHHLQTLEGSPVLVHTGPFGNVSQGASSVIADRLALRLAEVVVTGAGFGADLGAEKFFDIKCRQSGLSPAVAVLVTTVGALKHHGASARAPDEEDVAALGRGAGNLERHVDILHAFGVPVIVAVNVFATDTPAEIDAACGAAAAGARAAVPVRGYAEGSAGALELARTVIAEAREARSSALLYPDEMPLGRKVEALATRAYGAGAVEYTRAAAAQLEDAERLAADLICMPSRDRVTAFSPTGPGSTARSVIARCACPVLLTTPERDE